MLLLLDMVIFFTSLLPHILSPPLPLLPFPSLDSQASHVVEEEEEEDGEYNFLADSLREEEKEEFRNDRAVRIPRMEWPSLLYMCSFCVVNWSYVVAYSLGTYPWPYIWHNSCHISTYYLKCCMVCCNIQQSSCSSQPGPHWPLQGSCCPAYRRQLLCVHMTVWYWWHCHVASISR